jgi:V8-like Glu-specific endopeptidase
MTRRFQPLRLLITALVLAAPLAARAQDDSCQYAFDNECDEGRYGGGVFCADGTDTTDCRAISATADCEYAFDYECDDASVGGTGFCANGTDTFDCRILALAQPDNSCVYAMDNECDEPRFNGTGVCRDGTDTGDCQAQTDALDTLIAALPDDVAGILGNDSCRWANDGECDAPAIGGTGACDDGTDATDCRALAMGGDDSCEWANDGECDDPGIGTGACTTGTDMTDCEPIAFLRNRTNMCLTAFDRVCNEPGTGDGTCEANSDTADCIGRGRPDEAYDHFFGRDDRFLVDTNEMPWRAIGLLISPDSTCSGSLVGPDLVLTAAHCVTNDGVKTILPEVFQAGATGGQMLGEARIVSAIFAPDYTPDQAPIGQGNGNDWALVRLDRPLGNDLGYLSVHVLTDAEIATTNNEGILVAQAGYSWDTGDNLSGHMGCRLTDVYGDGSVLHECDTTHGDSGSPILLNVGGEYQIIAVDSQFVDPEDKNNAFSSGNLAVDSRAFIKDLIKMLEGN